MHRGSLSQTVVAFFDMASDSKCEKSFFGSKIAPRVALLNPKVIKNRPSNHMLASKISQAHHPNTFWMLLLAQSWSRGVSAPSFGGPERPPGPPKTCFFIKESNTFPLCAPRRFWTAQGPQTQCDLNTLCTSAPCPLSIVFSTFLRYFVPTPGSPPALAPAPHAGPLAGSADSTWPAATGADPE